MTNIRKGLIVALLHILIVLSLGGKFLYDRTHRPRVWVKTGSIDPDLPIRGRYLTLSLEVHAPELARLRTAPNYNWQSVVLAVENGELVAHSVDTPSGMSIGTGAKTPTPAQDDLYFLSPAVDLFIPEHAETPHPTRDDEVWAEVTIPRKGPPRPIQLAIKHGSQWMPLTYR
jgi:hypothetical protein